MAVTRLGLAGGSRGPYGSFAGKAGEDVVILAAEETHPPGMRYSSAQSKLWIREEDDLLIALIQAFLHIKDN
jgi:hypothetical protein